MKPIKIWFGGTKPLEIFYKMKKESGSMDMDRNIENLTNTSSLKIQLSEITMLEFLVLKEMVSKIVIDKAYYGEENCNMELLHIPDEFKDTLRKMEKIYNSIQKETGKDLTPYYPFALIQYDVTIYLDGYRIFQFFGSDLQKLFEEEITEVEVFHTKVFQYFYNTFYNALFARIGINPMKRVKDFVKIFMNDYHYAKIDNSELALLDMVKYPEKEINFHFIDSDDDITEFNKKIKGGNPEDIRVSFLMNTSIFTYVKFIDYVTDHQPYEDILVSNQYRMAQSLKDYHTRISQLFDELTSHRKFELSKEKFDPIVSSFYLCLNLLIKYRIEMSLQDLVDMEIDVDDIISEGSGIEEIFIKTKSILKNMI